MFIKEDNTYNELNRKAVEQWLLLKQEAPECVDRDGAKVTAAYIGQLNQKIRELETKNALKDRFLKKLKLEKEALKQTMLSN